LDNKKDRIFDKAGTVYYFFKARGSYNITVFGTGYSACRGSVFAGLALMFTCVDVEESKLCLLMQVFRLFEEGLDDLLRSNIAA
jgi:UDP-glucose 6-dehydrogenase